MKFLNTAVAFAMLLVSFDTAPQTKYPYFSPGGALSCTGTCPQQTVNMASGSFITGLMPQSNLASCTVNAQTGTSYTLVLADANQCVSMNNSASNTLTVPPHSSVALPVGTRETLYQSGSGTTTVTAGSGVTFTNVANAAYNTQLSQVSTQFPIQFKFGSITLRQTSTDVWNIESFNNGILPLATNIAGGNTCTNTGASCPTLVANGSLNYLAFGINYHTTATNGDHYDNYFGMNGTGDLEWETAHSNNQFSMDFDNPASGPSGIFMHNDLGNGPVLITDGSTDPACGYAFVTNPVSATGCGVLDTNGNGTPFLMVQDGAVIIGEWVDNLEKHWIGFSANPVVWYQAASANTNDAQSQFGESTVSTSTTQVAGPSIANTQVCNPSCLPLAGVLSGTTGSIGGGALLAGQCTSGTASVASSTTGMSVVATPVTYPGDGTDWKGYVSVAGTVTVKVCALVAVTPSSSAYNVRVIQ